MRVISFPHLLCAIAAHALADMTTVTDFVTLTPTASTQLAVSTSVQTTLATFMAGSTSVATPSAIQTTSQASFASTSPAPSAAPTEYNSPSGASGTGIDSDAGASGSGSSFSISKGGLIAIIVVVVIVAVFGIASTILFVVAKRRQWNIRASIARASRRLTGRSGIPPTPRSARHDNRRTAMQGGRLDSPAGGQRSARMPSHKRGLVVDERDVEKGASGGRTESDGVARKAGWSQRLWGNDWK